ncbi:hypothetical protein [Moraxella lacunata]
MMMRLACRVAFMSSSMAQPVALIATKTDTARGLRIKRWLMFIQLPMYTK